MIKAMFEYTENKVVFSINGHANAGEYGNDLVCAATTGIVSGMLNVFDKRYAGMTDIKVDENNITVEFNMINENIEQDIDTLLTQLKTLEIQYPKNLKIKEVH